jgi:FkbM family methyltransferase
MKKIIKSIPMFPALAGLVRGFQERSWRWLWQGQWQSNSDLVRVFCVEFPQVIDEPVFVKVGANDGVTGDPCSDILMVDSRWKGLLIEPVPYCFERLRANFRDADRFTLEQVAVGPRASKAPFYYVKEEAKESLAELPAWFDQLGSFDRQHILKHLDGVLEPFVTEMDVEVLPLSEILQRNHIQDCHLLHIDTEGYDYQVLKTLDFSVTSPTAILIEHRHLGRSERKQLMGLLRKNRYIVRDCGADYFAIHRDANQVLRRHGSMTPRP